MKNVLFAPLSHPYSHIAECLAIADELKHPELNVVFLTTADKRRFVEAQGYRVVTAPEPWQDSQMTKPADWLQDVDGVSESLKAEHNALVSFAPDLVIQSHRHTIGLVCRHLGIPMVSVLHPCLHPEFTGFPGIPRHLCDQHALDAIARTHDALTNRLQPAFRHLPVLVDDYRQLLLGQRNYYPCINGFWPDTLHQNKTHAPVFAGPIHWSGWTDLPEADWIDNNNPKVLVFFGSEIRDDRQFQCLKQLAPLALDVVLVANRKPQDLPGSIQHQLRANLRSAIESADIVISHGGINCLQLCLQSGTPCLTLPGQLEQAENALQASQLGIARNAGLDALIDALNELGPEQSSRRLSTLLGFMQRVEQLADQELTVVEDVKSALHDTLWRNHCQQLGLRWSPEFDGNVASKRIASDCLDMLGFPRDH